MFTDFEVYHLMMRVNCRIHFCKIKVYVHKHKLTCMSMYSQKAERMIREDQLIIWWQM